MIRPMKPEDIDSIVAIEEKSFSQPWTKQAFKDELSNDKAYYIVIEKDNRIVGYGGFWKILDEGHFTNLAIDPQYRGRGFGIELVQSMKALAIELLITKVTLEVRESNLVALRVYEKLGFYIEGKRSRYYSNPVEDAVIMWADLH